MQVSQEVDEKNEPTVRDDRTVKILLADDQVFNLILLEGLITSIFPNAIIETSMNGKLAVEKVEECETAGSPIEIIFMDIGMPEMDGLEASSLIQKKYQEGQLSSKPYIAAITAYTSEEMKRKATSNGMEKFLTKPAMIQNVTRLI